MTRGSGAGSSELIAFRPLFANLSPLFAALDSVASWVFHSFLSPISRSLVTIDTSIANDGGKVRSVLSHEVGHIDDARTNTAQNLLDSAVTKRNKGSTPHDRRPEEQRANNFRDRVTAERKQFGKVNKQCNKQLKRAEKHRIEQLRKEGIQ